MKCISLWQPWASAMFIYLPDDSRLKRIETRSWKTNYRGPLLIHAAKTFPPEARRFAEIEATLNRIPCRLPLGQIIGQVYLESCIEAIYLETEVSPLERLYGDYSPGRWGWVTYDAVLFEKPIPFKGKQGLFDVPDEILMRDKEDAGR